MFDFFKDTFAEMNGFDVTKMKEERKEIDKAKNKKITTIIIYAIGILYFILAVFNVIYILKTQFSYAIFKYILLSLVDVAALILFPRKKNEYQIAAWTLIAIFVVANFVSVQI